MRYFSCILLAIITTIMAVPVSATVIDIPDDYPTIQEGIDASSDGDTVLVQPGTYVENINFNGRNIVLGSLFLTTEDTSYISSTIIDGDSSGSVIVFENSEDSTAVITGFTIQNGYSYNGGGIYCNLSNPLIIKNIITLNSCERNGGGICCDEANPRILDNYLNENTADGWDPGPWGDHPIGTGGGICCFQSHPVIINNIIRDNTANTSGGGIFCNVSNPEIINNIIADNSVGSSIFCSNSDPIIRNNTVSANSGSSQASGIYCYYNSDPVISNTIFWGNRGSEIYADSTSFPTFSYCDIRRGWEGEGNIDINPLILDLENGDFNICAQSPCIDAGDPNMSDPDGSRSDIGAFFPDHPECEMGNSWHVSVSGDDVSGDGSPGSPFRTIQHATDVAFHRDTVIVENGIYLENISCFESIVLASNYIFTQDTLDIQNTVVDGDNGGPVITMISCDSLSAIVGFTIKNGTAYNGHGIYGDNSDLAISDNIITGNSGSGIVSSDSYIGNNTISGNSGNGIICGNSTVINNVIIDNSRDGITCSGRDVVIVNNIIGGNSGYGIGCFTSNAVITSNTVSFNNYVGISCQNNSDPIISNTIVWGHLYSEISAYGDMNNPVVTYSDIEGGWEGEGNIDIEPLLIDPFTGNYNICAESPCIDAGDPGITDPDGSRSDIGFFFSGHPECGGGDKWHVSVDGDDDTGDGSQDNPFRTIQHGINVSFQGDSVIVENGTYVENITCTKSIVLASNYIFTRDTLDIQNTVIDGDSITTVVTLVACDSLTLITGFTITNGTSYEDGAGIECRGSEVRIENNIVTGNAGSGIFCFYSNPSIFNNIIRDNSKLSNYNGGIRCDHSDPLISHNIISGNPFSGISCDYSSPAIIFNTISDNSEEGGGARGGGIRSGRGSPLILNNLISGNSSDQTGGGIYHWDYDSTAIINNNVICYNSAVEGGGIHCSTDIDFRNNVVFGNSGGGLSVWGGTIVNSIIRSNTLYEIEGAASFAYCNVEGGWSGQGNIDIDPIFRDAENGDFHLMAISCGDPEDSPCIDAGNPSIEDIYLDCSWGLGELRSDMGAYGGGDSTMVGVDEQEIDIPQNFALFQNYPNPFNPTTIIEFDLPNASHVSVEIYDILGRLVKTLLDDYRQAGTHQITFDASALASGVYFYRFQTGDITITKKMMLLK